MLEVNVDTEEKGPPVATQVPTARSKVQTLPEAIKRYVHNGATVCIEGFTHAIPVAAGHEIIRQAHHRPDAGPDDRRHRRRPADRRELCAKTDLVVRG